MLTQEHYLKRLLEIIWAFDDTIISTPYDVNTHLMKNRGDKSSLV